MEAGRERPKWLAMLARLRERFPECKVYGDALHLLAPSSATACYPGILFLPITDVDHRIGFQVSFLAPYYVLYSFRAFPVERNVPPATRLTPDDSERPYWEAIAREIEETYRAEYMPPEIGNVIVPDFQQNRVVEYNAEGKQIHQINVQWPNSATRLPNGNTLVASQNTRKVIEFNLTPTEASSAIVGPLGSASTLTGAPTASTTLAIWARSVRPGA